MKKFCYILVSLAVILGNSGRSDTSGAEVSTPEASIPKVSETAASVSEDSAITTADSYAINEFREYKLDIPEGYNLISVSPKANFVLLVDDNNDWVVVSPINKISIENPIEIPKDNLRELGSIENNENTAWSPNEKFIAFSNPRALVRMMDSDIFLLDIEKNTIVNVTDDGVKRDEGEDPFSPAYAIEYFPVFFNNNELYYATYNVEGCKLMQYNIKNGEIVTKEEFADKANLYVKPIVRNDELFFNLAARDVNDERFKTIYKYSNDKIEKVYSYEKSLPPRLNDVSFDGKKLIFYVIDEYNGGLSFFLYNTDDDTSVLLQTGAYYTVNAKFVAGSNSILLAYTDDTNKNGNIAYKTFEEKEYKTLLSGEDMYIGGIQSLMNKSSDDLVSVANNTVLIGSGYDKRLYKYK